MRYSRKWLGDAFESVVYLRCAAEFPVELRFEQNRPHAWRRHADILVHIFTGLEDDNAHVGIFGQTVCECKARCASADDNGIVALCGIHIVWKRQLTSTSHRCGKPVLIVALSDTRWYKYTAWKERKEMNAKERQNCYINGEYCSELIIYLTDTEWSCNPSDG